MAGRQKDIIKPPGEAQQIKRVEEKLGIPLPMSFRMVVLEYTAGMEMNWRLPDDDELSIPLPEELRGLFAGNFTWSLKDIVDIEKDRKSWELEVFPDIKDEYDRVWHNKLAFMEVGNGDYIAFDLSVPNDPPVVYLSHDDGEGHRYILGDNFVDFMNRWTQIGCVGCEDWQLVPFMQGKRTGILPDCENSKKWRGYLKVDQ